MLIITYEMIMNEERSSGLGGDRMKDENQTHLHKTMFQHLCLVINGSNESQVKGKGLVWLERKSFSFRIAAFKRREREMMGGNGTTTGWDLGFRDHIFHCYIL
jgi:hypothetical protein